MAVINNPLDIHGNVGVNVPLNADEAGFVQIAGKRGTSVPARRASMTAEGELRVAASTRRFDCDFNGAAAAALVNNQWYTNLTTMTATTSGGFLRLNAGASAAINVGASIVTAQTFVGRDHSNLKLSGLIRTLGAAQANKQAEFGFGYYDIAANQANPMNEFAGFRWTLTGGLIAVLGYSVGGAATEVTVNVNGGVPYADNVTRNYEVVIDEEGVDYFVDGVLVAFIPQQPDAAGPLKSSTYPVVFRLFNGPSAPAIAPQFDIGGCFVSVMGPAGDEDRNVLQVMQGRHANRAQAGVHTTGGALSAIPASGTAPTAIAGSNTTPALVGLGGNGRCTLTGVTATLHSEILFNGYVNPVIPEAAGAANNARSLVITDIIISPLIVSVLLAGGGFSAQWFVAFGGTGISLATADANGGANAATKANLRMPLPIIDTLPATAAVGTIATRTGEQGLINLSTPIVLAPGECISVGMRTLFVTAAVTAGAVDFGVSFNGYWV